MRWRVKKADGKIYGPADEEVFRRWIQEKRILATDLISEEDLDNWRRVDAVPQLTGGSPTPSPQAPGEPAAAAKPVSKLGAVEMRPQDEVQVTCPGCGRKWHPSTVICTDCGTNVATGEPGGELQVEKAGIVSRILGGLTGIFRKRSKAS